MDNLVIFKLFFVIEVPINPMTTAPAHLTPTSNRLCYPALSVSFLEVAFTSKLGKGKIFRDVKYKPSQWRLEGGEDYLHSRGVNEKNYYRGCMFVEWSRAT